MEKVQTLVGSGNLSGALDYLIQYYKDIDKDKWNTCILLKSRYVSNNNDWLSGILTSDEFNREKAKISHSILSITNLSNSFIKPVETPNQVTSSYEESRLTEIIIQNKRRRPEIAEEAQLILNEFTKHKQTKNVDNSYDITNRKLKSIIERFDSLNIQLNELKEQSLEETVERIKELISETIPSWSNLAEAYILCNSKGMIDTYVVSQINNKPEDDDAKINVAEKIELFLSKIQVK